MAEDSVDIAATADDVEQVAATGGKPTMRVKVYAPFKVYFEGEAFSVSAINETGPFDILPHHRNFLCMLVPCVLKVGGINGEKSIKISRALMHVKSDSVVVFMDV